MAIPGLPTQIVGSLTAYFQDDKLFEEMMRDMRRYPTKDDMADAMSYAALRGGPYGRDDRAEEMLRKWVRYLNPDHLLNFKDDFYNPDFIVDFIWGPQGEWTGLPMTQEIAERTKRGRSGINTRFGDTHFLGDCLMPDGSRLPAEQVHEYYRTITPPDLRFAIYFSDYEGMLNYLRSEAIRGDDVRVTVARNAMPSLEPDALALGGALQTLRIEHHPRFTEWLAAMESRKYTFGYGTLRDARNRFDPLGVLADINGVKWEWDADESAWAVSGDVYQLSNDALRALLDISKSVSTEHVASFARTVSMFSDCLKDFKQFTATLLAGREVIEKRRQRLRDFMQRTVPYQEPMLGVYDGRAMGNSESVLRHRMYDPSDPNNWDWK